MAGSSVGVMNSTAEPFQLKHVRLCHFGSRRDCRDLLHHQIIGFQLYGHVDAMALIAHQLKWQHVEAHVSIFQESSIAGEPRERQFHIHSIHRNQLCTKYLHIHSIHSSQLCTKYIYPFTLL